MFFIDESQRVILQDIGRVEEIRKWAEEEKAQVTEMELVSQFRCNGSDGYLAWVDHTLEIRDTANFDMQDIDYDIRILDSPSKMQDLIIERNRTSHDRARILAGYCWNRKKEADEIIKNTYRTLMTRGIKGCYVYCTDQRLAAHLKKCLATRKSEGKK